MYANRAAFMFRSMGHPNVKVLDGHFTKWTKEGKPVESGAKEVEIDAKKVEEKDFDYTYNSENVLSYDDVVKIRDNLGAQI